MKRTRKLTYAPLMVTLMLLLTECGASIPIKMPRFPTGSTGEQLKAVMVGKRVLGIVAVRPQENIARLSYIQDNWTSSLESSVASELTKRGYFKIVDLAHRKERLRELAHTQTGITDVQKEFGQELSVDGLLVLNLTSPPRSECKTETLSNSFTYGKAALQLGLAMAANGNAGDIEVKSPTGVRYLTVFVQGKIVNIETGRTISYSHTKPYRLPNDVGNRDCPSELTAFHMALDQAAKSIADNLSPEIVSMNVPLETAVKDVPGAQAASVKKLLKSGIQWAKEGDMSMAAQTWEDALNESGGRSVSALWNLGVYKWYSGDMNGADKYFRQAMRAGGPDWINKSGKRKFWSLFRKEKERKKLEQQ